jgi:hypothetical protein
MFKSAGLLLLLLGLAVGLWLGFNPQAHAKVVQSWNNTKTSFVRLETNFSTTISAWTVRSKAQAQTGQKSVSGTTTKSFSTVWRQIVSAWDNLLASLQGVWHRMVANINLK